MRISICNGKEVKTILLAGGAAGLLLAISTPSVIAQEVSSALNVNNASEDIEVIEVSGIRSSLENALNVKREASSIVDAISATDIDSLPALDLGEALQAIPGIQLERSGEGRQSEITLRGLSGGFVKTTAFGQSFATPSRSFDDVGDANPFSAFEAGVFDGVTVVKTPTADMQVGGIAGVIDKKLQQALGKKDGAYNISVGGRYEELTENWDPAIKFSASKHLIKDELAVAFKFAGSGQTFRRDTANFTTYAPIGIDHPRGGTRGSNSETHLAYREKWGLSVDDDLRGVASARNVSEYSDGDRISFTGNIEWKPIEDLRLGSHLLYTERNLDSGTKQDAQFTSGYNSVAPNNSEQYYKIEPDMDSAPFIYDRTADGKDVWGVTKTSISDGAYTFTNRETTFLETVKGVMLYGDYLVDDWKLDGVISYSESENKFNQLGLDFRFSGHHSNTKNVNGVNGVVIPPTGINVDIDAAYGDINNASVVATGWENIVYDLPSWESSDAFNALSLTTADPLNDGKQLQHYILGRIDNPKREMTSVEFNATRYTDFGFGNGLNFAEIKFGFRHSVEELENDDRQPAAIGLNADAIDATTVHSNLVSEGQADFFNGEYNGAFGASSGWNTLSNIEHLAKLIDGLRDISGAVLVEDIGLYERMLGATSSIPQLYGTNFDVEQSISAAYVMTNFVGEIGSIPLSGNVGVRYVNTDNVFDGFRADIETDTLTPVNSSDDYDYLLPSLNLSFELHEDVVLRGAYNKGIVRPNLRVLTPSTAVSTALAGTQTQVRTRGADIKPYEADNYDLSLAWYNREGSAVSMGLFYKELSGFILSTDTCNEGDQEVIDAIGGTYTRTDNASTGGFACTEDALRANNDGDLVNRELRVIERYNSDGAIKLTGVEFAVQQKLDFLPYPWNGFGGVFNYTYIDQKSDESVSGDDNQLYQVAPESYNLIGYYENDGMSFRLAYNWKDDSLLKGENSFLGTLPRVQQANGRLDFSASYRFAKGANFTVRAYNLTDEKRIESWGFDERAISRVDYTGRILEASVSYNF